MLLLLLFPIIHYLLLLLNHGFRHCWIPVSTGIVFTQRSSNILRFLLILVIKYYYYYYYLVLFLLASEKLSRVIMQSQYDNYFIIIVLFYSFFFDFKLRLVEASHSQKMKST